MRGLISLTSIVFLAVAASTALAVDPNPLEDAYWRFEEGTTGGRVATDPDTGSGVPDAVPDSINANHMRTFNQASAPTYTDDVPTTLIPRTGQANDLALRFTPNQDVYTNVKNIENPITEAFTLEAAFKAEALEAFQAIVGRDGQPTTDPEQTAVLKIRGDSNVLQWEQFDKAGTRRSIESLSPVTMGQWYYAAVVNDGETVSLYLDSGFGYVLQGTSPVSGAMWEGEDPDEGWRRAWTIGRGQYNSFNTDWFTGVIDEVRLSNVALDESDFLFAAAPLPGDFNYDGKVDGADLSMLEACRTGPDVPYDVNDLPPGCTMTPVGGFLPADFDQDGDVDQDDFGTFQTHYDP